MLAINGLFKVCPGDSVTLTASGAYNNYYLWNPATGLNTNTGSVVIAKPAVTTTYLLRGYSQYGYCQADTQITITVSPPPTITFTTVPAGFGIAVAEPVLPQIAGTVVKVIVGGGETVIVI